jgi:hypothetical protein
VSDPNRPEVPDAPSHQIQVELDDATAQGIYTNLALVAHTETEFLFDFLFVQPQQPKAKVRARIISSPTHTKRFFLALRENLTRYEVRFGEIKTGDGGAPPGPPHE